MSNGSPKGAWEDVPLDPDTLMSAVAAQTAAVEDAGGDVKAANVRLREAVMEAQAEVSSARERLGVRQQEVIRNLTDMGLMGRAIRITAGPTLATGYYHEDDEIRTREVAEPVDGISGTI
ncbi:MAG TPA: hypothetical protein VHA37_08815, partial [Candidatus Saccharimonadales bacterium]|nr:hypothetical protein [Candidatus Saccharimonadales bacterium]